MSIRIYSVASMAESSLLCAVLLEVDFVVLFLALFCNVDFLCVGFVSLTHLPALVCIVISSVNRHNQILALTVQVRILVG